MIQLLPVPAPTDLAVRLIAFTGEREPASVYRRWAARAGPRLDLRLWPHPATEDESARVRRAVRALPGIVPTVLVVTGDGPGRAFDLCAEPGSAPQHVVVVGVDVTAPRTGLPVPVTVVIGDREPPATADWLRTWRAASTSAVDFRVLDGTTVSLRSADSPVAALLTAMFRTIEAFPTLDDRSSEKGN